MQLTSLLWARKISPRGFPSMPQAQAVYTHYRYVVDAVFERRLGRSTATELCVQRHYALVRGRGARPGVYTIQSLTGFQINIARREQHRKTKSCALLKTLHMDHAAVPRTGACSYPAHTSGQAPQDAPTNHPPASCSTCKTVRTPRGSSRRRAGARKVLLGLGIRTLSPLPSLPAMLCSGINHAHK